MKVQIYGSPQFQFVLPQGLIDPLLLLSEHHYDRRCQEAGEPRGFLYGWKNREECAIRFPDTGPCLVHATFEELDRSCKIMESIGMALLSKMLTEEQAESLRRLRDDFHRAMTAANSAVLIWRAECGSDDATA